jgi:signal transduction histidine kinase/ActR/RegA family two-component response regulator
MPLVDYLWLVDSEGRRISSSHDAPPPALASFNPLPADLPANAIAVSNPFRTSKGGPPLVALAMRLDGVPSARGGWILAALPASDLLGAFTAATPAADARMAVFRRDGLRLAGDVMDRLLDAGQHTAQHLPGRARLELRQFPDGSEHLVALHQVPRYGLSLVLTRDLAALLQSWRVTTRLALLVAAAALAVMAAAVAFVQRADRQRAREQQAMQAQQARSNKLQSLGTLAGGVAHDFNNVLAAVVGFAEMAQDAAPPGSAQARHLGKVLQAARRGIGLVERILSFSRGGARESRVFALEPVVDEVLNLLAASLREGVVLERDLDAAEARLRGDPTQIFEAVMNLCTNAMQAMPGGGLLSVQLRRVEVLTPRVLSHSSLPAGRYAMLVVADQGGGMSSEVLDHLFEPFFTTRSAAAGTGLGLAVVHGVVGEFDGAIDVQSALGRGARFTLYLPECAAPATEQAPAQRAVQSGAGQRLLVVDDEPALCALAEKMLRGLGYDPVCMTDPSAALQLILDDPERFDALITDEVMPGLSGTQLTARLRAQGVQLPVMLVSGYGGALLAQRATMAGVTRVMSKPLQRVDLALALNELLGAVADCK